MSKRDAGPQVDRRKLPALFLVASLLLAFQSELPAQSPRTAGPSETPQTAIGSYLERAGILIVKRQHALPPIELGNGAEMRLFAITAHEPGMEHQRVMGIRVEIDRPDRGGDPRVLYLDLNEIDELARAINFMQSAMGEESSAQPGEPTEMRIATRDGLEVGVRFAAGGASAFLRTASASFPIQPRALAALRSNLDEGRRYLFSD